MAILQIDRVVYAWASLEALANTFASVGLTTDYGGIHTNGATHMSTLGFDDGTYLEIVSVRQAGQQAPIWQQHIATNGGPCAWSISIDDLHRVSDRLQALEIPVGEPRLSKRRRPDGEMVEAEIVFLGSVDTGSLHPFMIRDRTPHENRVRISDSVRGSELAGLDSVVLAVSDLEATADAFQHIYGVSAPIDIEVDAFPARTVQFQGEPVVLTTPGSPDDWIAQRLERYGPGPCGCLIKSTDIARSYARLPLAESSRFGDREIGWIDSEMIRPLHIGIVSDREQAEPAGVAKTDGG